MIRCSGCRQETDDHAPSVRNGGYCRPCTRAYQAKNDRSQEQRDRREARLVQGLCGIHTTEPLLLGMRICARCQDNQRSARDKAKADGICARHRRENRPAKPGTTLCQECHWQAGEDRLRRDFGITLEDYAWMEHRQNRVCAICLESCPSGQSLAVDHNHETEAVRGLLCIECNREVERLAPHLQRLLTYLR